MKSHTFLLFGALTALASPVPQAADDDACTAEPLTQATWDSLQLSSFLDDFTANNISADNSNGVQNLAAAFGAPNFFCGLDAFCNAGQPCSPVELPEWYALVAIQNWNSYMNQLFTALTATSNIISLQLPALVADLYPDPRDDVTELKTMTSIFASALSIIPFTGAASTAVGVIAKTSNFISGQIQTPAPTDRFMKWTNIASSMGGMVQVWQNSITDSIQATLDAQVSSPQGIAALINDGKFLGSSRNVTQTELQNGIQRSIELYAIGLMLQAQGVFIHRSQVLTPEQCADSDVVTCFDEPEGTRGYFLTKRDGDDNATNQSDLVAKLVDTYGLTTEQIFVDPAACFFAADNVQGVYPFGDALPVDPSTKCIFMLQTCNQDFVPKSDTLQGIVAQCRSANVNVDADGPQ